MGLDITYYSKMTKAKDNEAFDETGEGRYCAKCGKRDFDCDD